MDTLPSLSTSPTELVFHSFQASLTVDDIIILKGARHGANHCTGIITLNPLHSAVIIPPLKRKNLKFREVEVTWQEEESQGRI